jgi:hypothetical protein
MRDGRAAQTDIYRYDLQSRQTTRVTETQESEYSPTVTPDGRSFTVIRVEADGTQRLWRFTLDGKDPSVVLADVKPVGYHAWADATLLALFVLGQPATLQVGDARTGRAEIVARNVGRSIQRIPGGGISFVQRGSRPDSPADAPAPLTIMELDAASRKIGRLTDAVPGAREADLAWMPDGTLLMAHDNALHAWRRGDAQWTRAIDLAAAGIRGATRIAVSPKGDAIAIVASGS